MWSYRVEGWSDPYATWDHDATIKVAADVDTELMLEEGARVLERALAEVSRTPEQATCPARRGARAARRHPPGRGPAEGRHLARGPGRDARPAAARVRHRQPQPRVAGRARARPVRRLVRDLPPLRGRAPRTRDRAVDQRHVRHRPEAAAGHRRHGLRRRLPHARPPDRPGQPQGPEQHPRRRAEHDPGSPYAIGSADGGHDAIHPDLGTFDDFDRFVAEARAARPRGRPRPRAAGCARPPVGARRTPSCSRPARTARSPTPRTRPRSTRTSTRSTSTTTPRAPTPRCAGSCRCGSTTGSRSSASTTRTPSRSSSGSG